MTKKPVVAFILPDLTAGGAEMVLIRLMNALDRNQYTPVFIVVSNRGTLKNYVAKDIPFHALDQSGVFKSLPKLYTKIKEINPDIIITTMAHMNFAALLLRLFFLKTKFIVRESTLPACTLHERGISGFFIRILYRLLYPLADKIVAPANIILEKLHEELGIGTSQMALLPNPINIPAITTSARKDEKIHFVAAGRLHHEKGFDRLVKSMKDYRGGPWHLTILGEGDQRPILEEFIKALKFSDRVDLPGFSAEPWKEFAAADCFLLPSRWEGLPNAALEALACGIPVIAVADAGGIKQIATEAPEGAVIITRDILEMLKAMEKITPATTRESLVPEKYRQDVVMQKFQKILQDIL